MDCPFAKEGMHDDDQDDPPDEELQELEPQIELPIPIVGEKPQEGQETQPVRMVPDIEPTTEEIVRETVPDDVAASVPDPEGGKVEVPVPTMPGPGPAPVRVGGGPTATIGTGGGAALGASSGARASALAGASMSGGPRRADTGSGNTPAAASVAINRAFRGLVSRQIVPSRAAAGAALVRPPGAAQGAARANANLRGLESAGRRSTATRGLINRARAGVAEEATARTFAARRPLMAMMAAGAGAQVAISNRPGRRPGGTQTPRGRYGGGAFFFNQSAQIRRLLGTR